MPRNSYLRQIAQRSHSVSDRAEHTGKANGRVNSLPILHPIRPLFQQREAQQPFDMEEEAASSQDLTVARATQPSALTQGTESIAMPSVVQRRENLLSAFPHPVGDLPAATAIAKDSNADAPNVANADTRLRSMREARRLANPSLSLTQIAPESSATHLISLHHSPVTPTTPSTTTTLPLSTASSSSVSMGSNVIRDTPSDRSDVKLTPVPPVTRSLSSASAAHLEPPVSTKKLEEQVSQTGSVKQPSTAKLNVVAIESQPQSPDSLGIVSSSRDIGQPVRSTLEPIHKTQPMSNVSTPVPPPSRLPSQRHPETSEKSTIHIGAIDIQITPPPVVIPQPTPRAAPRPTTPLSRGFASSFGLRQG